MADWDDDEWDVPDLNKPAQNEPPSTWSDEEEEDAPAPAPAAPQPRAAPKEKTGLAAKIEERERREAEEAKQKAALREQLDVGNLDSIEGLEGEALEKARQQKLQEAADLDNAIDAFGLMPNKPRPTEALKEGEIEAFQPKTDKEFEALAGLIDKKLKSFQGQPGHLLCIKELLRKATASLTTDEAKDLSTFVSVLYNDKVKADRDKDKKGKKTKAKAKVSVNAGKAMENDMDDWGGGGGQLRDDDYDFM